MNEIILGQQFSEGGLMTFGGPWSLRPFQGIHEIKTMFIVILRHVPSLLSFTHKCVFEFFRGYVMCDYIIVLMVNRKLMLMYSCF